MENWIGRDGLEGPETVRVESCPAGVAPSYPDARQWAGMVGALGLAAASMSASCSALKPGKEKPLAATSPDSILYGTHDYRYTIRAGDTLESLAKGFYDDGSAGFEAYPDRVRFDPAPHVAKLAAANPKLGVTSGDAPLPVGAKILIPEVSRVSFGS